MTATREILVDDPDDKESYYACDCGFVEYLSETCSCEDCLKYKAILPLTHCPRCGVEFVVKALEPDVYCHACSVAGGADRAVYHAPPVCS